MGYNRNIAHVIHEGPYQYGGAAMLVTLYILLIDGLNTRQAGTYRYWKMCPIIFHILRQGG
eukprot:5778743-Ditylum_brightwellii.AAC.1